MNTDIAAGQAYTTLTLKNISQKACDVIGNNQPQVMYPTSVNNFQIQLKSQPIAKVFTLAPDQTIYSLIHFPNGPQCSSEATNVNAGVSYSISAKDTVSFKPTTGDTLDIPSCGKQEDITMIDLYSFSDVVVLPQETTHLDILLFPGILNLKVKYFMKSTHLPELDILFEALAHKHRREIIFALSLQPYSISQLAAMRGLSLPAIHKHIKVLEKARIITQKKVGRVNFLALNRTSLQGLQEWLYQFQAYWGTDKETLENYAKFLNTKSKKGGENK